nr:hypothetical protein CFP56_44484 [Quercus suber]
MPEKTPATKPVYVLPFLSLATVSVAMRPLCTERGGVGAALTAAGADDDDSERREGGDAITRWAHACATTQMRENRRSEISREKRLVRFSDIYRNIERVSYGQDAGRKWSGRADDANGGSLRLNDRVGLRVGEEVCYGDSMGMYSRGQVKV